MSIHKTLPVLRAAAVFLQITVVLVGVIVFTALLIEPQLEARNTHSTLFQTYFSDPFLAYIYLESIPFFVALYQAFKALGYARQNKMLSQAAVKRYRIIKYCALITMACTVTAVAYIRIAAQNSHDDPAGAAMLGMIIIFVSVLVAAVAAVFEKNLQNAIDIQSDN